MTEQFDVYSDQFAITVGGYGVTFLLQRSPSVPQPGQTTNENIGTVRMSLEHAKVVSMILRRQLKQFEREAGFQIQVMPQVMESAWLVRRGLGLDLGESMLSDRDLTQFVRPFLANSPFALDRDATAQLHSLGLRAVEVTRAICHPTSYVSPIDYFADSPHGRMGVIICPVLEPPLRVVLWLRDNPADPPIWIEVTGLSQ